VFLHVFFLPIGSLFVLLFLFVFLVYFLLFVLNLVLSNEVHVLIL